MPRAQTGQQVQKLPCMLGPVGLFSELWQTLMKYKTVNWITNRKAASFKPQAPSAANRGPGIKTQASSAKVREPRTASIKPRT